MMTFSDPLLYIIGSCLICIGFALGILTQLAYNEYKARNKVVTRSLRRYCLGCQDYHYRKSKHSISPKKEHEQIKMQEIKQDERRKQWALQANQNSGSISNV
jgi:hypothetical protein